MHKTQGKTEYKVSTDKPKTIHLDQTHSLSR